MKFLKKNWIWLTIIAVLIILLCFWYFDLFNFATRTNLPVLKKITYEGKNKDYSITYVNNWKQLTSDELAKKGVDFDVAFINKKDENVVIGINKPIAKDQPYETDINASLEILKSGLTEQYKDRSFSISDVSSGTIDEIPYLSITYVLDGIKQIQRFYITSDKLYIVVASAPKNIFDKYSNDVDNFLKNYKVTQ